MNPLDRYPAARRIAYYVQFVVAGVILLIAVGYSAAAHGLPGWYAVVAAVTQGLWSYLGLTAGNNTDVTKRRTRRHRSAAGAVDGLTVLAIAILVVLLLILLGYVR